MDYHRFVLDSTHLSEHDHLDNLIGLDRNCAYPTFKNINAATFVEAMSVLMNNIASFSIELSVYLIVVLFFV